MRKVIYSMGVSLDGFIAGPGGEIDWSPPDEERHRFHNEETRELGAHFLGRRLYEEMVYWETADKDPSAGEVVLEFARIWQDLPKIVFSKTLEEVEGNARLVRDGAAEEVARLVEARAAFRWTSATQSSTRCATEKSSTGKASPIQLRPSKRSASRRSLTGRLPRAGSERRRRESQTSVSRRAPG